MASLLGSKRLICFYCSRKSSRRYVGSLREWECENCEAVNYLDESGEITDPPVAIVEEVPSLLQYARRSESPSFSPITSDPDNTLFCTDCLKNQHLVRSSLAQYVPEEQDTIAVDRNYLKFKESLEKRYPQVCEDCLPRVVERLKQSSYTAKTDHLRRLLDKTRQNVGPQRRRRTWLDVFDIIGQTSWVVGLSVQIFWGLLGVFEHFMRLYWGSWISDPFHSEPLSDPDNEVDRPLLASWAKGVLHILYHDGRSVFSASYYGVTIRNLAKWGLLLSFSSIWWNPKFKEGYRGYHRHIEGFHDWYRYQVLLLITRVTFWFLIKYTTFDHEGSSAAVGVHLFMMGFAISITAASRRCFKVDYGHLFAPTSPERLLPYVGRKEKSKYDGNDMSQALTSILEEPPSSVLVSSTNQVDFFCDNNLSAASPQNLLLSRYELATGLNPDHNGLTHRLPSRDPRDLLGIERKMPSLAEMTPDESLQYLSTGEVPIRMQAEVEYDASQDLMEWKPQNSQYRAFQPAQAPRQSQLFSQAPVVPDQSPFWFKGLPPAPISQAHKARNPPNVPRLQPRSQEAKRNFFDQVTGRQANITLPDVTINPSGIELPSVKSRHEIEFAQQRFFPPSASDAANGLSEMFEQAFTLKSSDGEGKEKDGSTSKKLVVSLGAERKRHIFTAFFLSVALFGWYFSHAHPELDALKIPLGIMTACAAIALRNIADGAMNWSEKKISYLQLVGAILAGVQTVASVHTITKILSGRIHCNTCQTQGAILVGIMLIQEVCFAAFSL